MQDYSFVWNQYDLIRGLFLEGVTKTTEEEADIVPKDLKTTSAGISAIFCSRKIICCLDQPK